MRRLVFQLRPILISLCLLIGCGRDKSGTAVNFGAEFGPLEVTVNIDESGKIAVVSGFSPHTRLSLGPVTLKVGIENTIELTKRRPYRLFILWQDEEGQVRRDEYEIGKAFRVKFNRRESVREITGQNDSIIITVEGREDRDREGQYIPRVNLRQASETFHGAEANQEQSEVSKPEEIWVDQVTPCTHRAHEFDLVQCSHPMHPFDVYACQHPCYNVYGYVVPCHPSGDVGPCVHRWHPGGDPVECSHVLHPGGDLIRVRVQ